MRINRRCNLTSDCWKGALKFQSWFSGKRKSFSIISSRVMSSIVWVAQVKYAVTSVNQENFQVKVFVILGRLVNPGVGWAIRKHKILQSGTPYYENPSHYVDMARFSVRGSPVFGVDAPMVHRRHPEPRELCNRKYSVQRKSPRILQQKFLWSRGESFFAACSFQRKLMYKNIDFLGRSNRAWATHRETQSRESEGAVLLSLPGYNRPRTGLQPRAARRRMKF